MTAVRSAFLASTAMNYGWIVKKENEGQSGKTDFESRENGANSGPRLILNIQPAGSGTGGPVEETTRELWHVYGHGIDEELAWFEFDPAMGVGSGTWKFPLSNVQGNVSAVTSLTAGTETGDEGIVEVYEYDLFGAFTAYSDPGSDGLWFTSDDLRSKGPDNDRGAITGSSASNSGEGAIPDPSDPSSADDGTTPEQYTVSFFQGRRWDDSLALYEFRARHYSPELGRFLQRDPALAHTPSHSFPWGSPATVSDAFGLYGYVTPSDARPENAEAMLRAATKSSYTSMINEPREFTRVRGNERTKMITDEGGTMRQRTSNYRWSFSNSKLRVFWEIAIDYGANFSKRKEIQATLESAIRRYFYGRAQSGRGGVWLTTVAICPDLDCDCFDNISIVPYVFVRDANQVQPGAQLPNRAMMPTITLAHPTLGLGRSNIDLSKTPPVITMYPIPKKASDGIGYVGTGEFDGNTFAHELAHLFLVAPEDYTEERKRSRGLNSLMGDFQGPDTIRIHPEYWLPLAQSLAGHVNKALGPGCSYRPHYEPWSVYDPASVERGSVRDLGDGY